MSTRKRQRRQRGGFTLMEILLVAAILVILASMATIGFNAMQRSATANIAKSEIQAIEQACGLFHINHLRYPASLDELTNRPSDIAESNWPGGGGYLDADDLNDPWGQPYRYQPDEANDRVVITSNGVDRKAQTDDDISNVARN
ncbi:MAG: type II secretion system protein GspG [Pirellulaceae bacterium]